jgi:hypothetical protein
LAILVKLKRDWYLFLPLLVWVTMIAALLKVG